MPLAGLINKHGDHIKFEDIIQSYKFEDWNQSLPKLMVYMRGKRVYEGSNIFASTTQLLVPTRIFWMQRYTDWYETVYEQMATYLGQKTHLLFEQSAAKLENLGWLTEVPYYVELMIDGRPIRVALMPDSIHVPLKTLYDYKVTKTWKVKKAKKPESWLPGGCCYDWTLQLSIYRWGVQHTKKIGIKIDEFADHPTPIHYEDPNPIIVDHAILDTTVKDHNRHDKEINATETFEVPLLSVEETESWIINRCRELLKYELGTVSNDYPDCTAEDIWLPENWEATISKAGAKKGSYWFKESTEKKVRSEAKKKLAYLTKSYPESGYHMTVKKPTPPRCMDFCFLSKTGGCHQFNRDFPEEARTTRNSYVKTVEAPLSSPTESVELFGNFM